MRTVSIVNLLKDEAEMLPLVVPSYAAIRPPRLKEWIVLDDDSTDNSRQVATDLAEEFGLPLVWVRHTMLNWADQRNRGLELASGDFVLNLDADMAISGNFVWLLDQGYFDAHDVWDFPVKYMRQDMWHYCVRSSTGVSTRMLKNVGIRYVGLAHEQPEAIAAGPVKTQLAYTRTRIDKAICPEVCIFECSLLGTDDSLRQRGERLKRWAREMTERGIPPGAPERYVRAKHSTYPIAPLPDPLRTYVVTLDDARRNGWSKLYR